MWLCSWIAGTCIGVVDPQSTCGNMPQYGAVMVMRVLC